MHHKAMNKIKTYMYEVMYILWIGILHDDVVIALTLSHCWYITRVRHLCAQVPLHLIINLCNSS